MSKIIKYIFAYYKKILFIVFFSLIQIFADLTLPLLMSNIIDTGISAGNIPYIVKTGLFMILVSLVSAGCTLTCGYLASKSAGGIGKDLRSALFGHVEKFSLYEFNDIGTASLVTRTTNDVTQVQLFLVMALRLVITAPIMMIGGVTMSASTNLQLSYIVMFSMPLILISILLIAKFALPIYNIIQKKLDNLNRIARENLSGIRVIKAFRTTDYEIKRFDKGNLDLAKITTKVQYIIGLMGPVITIILNVTLVIIMWVGATSVQNSNIEIGKLIAFTQYVTQITLSLVLMSMILIMYPKASVSAQRIAEVLNTEIQIKDTDIPKDNKNIKGKLVFDNVTFYYPGSDEPAINNLSFECLPGKTTAIIGSTGSGKSTIVNLIPRLYDVSDGKILLDDVDVREYDKITLRNKVGYVPQKGMLFSGSILENIRYGKNDATIAEVTKACETAQAINFIESKPDKFETHIAQGGTNVSGGQKQRLSIARALIKKPEVYVFDDSFSALDFKTDFMLRSALKKETQNSAVIIVAQRISSITDADQIIVLDEGNIVGKGTHKDLLISCSVYKEIASSQLSEEELKNEQS